MALVVVDTGMVRQLVRLAAAWPRPRKIGLFQNDPVIDRHTTIASLDPCVFSGYDGERDVGAWTLPSIEGDRAVSRSTPVIWTYDGGPATGYVFGYYVVDEDGELLWAERRTGLPVAMVVTGQDYTVIPVLSSGTRYGGVT